MAARLGFGEDTVFRIRGIQPKTWRKNDRHIPRQMTARRRRETAGLATS